MITDALVTIETVSQEKIETLAWVAKTSFVETWASVNTVADMAAYVAEKFSLENMQQEMSEPGSVFFMAQKDGSYLGYAKLRTSKIPVELVGRRCIEIERMYLLRSAKGHGVGSQLMQHCLDFARKAHYETVWLGVWAENPAVRFYTKWGFEWFGHHIFKLGDTEDRDELMKREL